MRRNTNSTSIGVLTCGLMLAVGAGAVAGVMPAGAASSSSSTDLQTTVQAVQNAAAAAVAEVSGSATPTAPGPASDPLPSLPASAAAPITVLSWAHAWNETSGSWRGLRPHPSGFSPDGPFGPRRVAATVHVHHEHVVLLPVRGEHQVEGGDMINNQDAGDISGLEEVFRSQEFGRASGTAAVGPAGVGLSVRHGDGILGTRFGRRPVAAPWGARETMPGHVARPTPLDLLSREPTRIRLRRSRRRFRPPVRVPGPGGARRGPSAWRRHSSRYWTIASVSALVALVAAGITAGAGQHPRSHVAAQGRHGRSRPGGGLNTSGAASTGLAAPGGLLADAAGSAGPSSVAGTNGRASFGQRARWTRHPDWGGDLHRRSGLASGAVGWRSERGGGWRGCGSPPPAGTNPAAPVVSTVGSTVSSATSSITTLANEIGTSVPAAASTTGAVNNAITTIDQAVSASGA